MKTRGLFLSALMMGAVMAGCSNEEAMNTDNENSLKKSDNYIAVNIVAPSEVATRGTSGENDFDSGQEEENNVKNAFFVFYNASTTGTVELFLSPSLLCSLHDGLTNQR